MKWSSNQLLKKNICTHDTFIYTFSYKLSAENVLWPSVLTFQKNSTRVYRGRSRIIGERRRKWWEWWCRWRGWLSGRRGGGHGCRTEWGSAEGPSWACPHVSSKFCSVYNLNFEILLSFIVYSHFPIIIQ